MSEKAHTETEQADNNADGTVQAVVDGVEWTEYGGIALGTLAGLAVNAVLVAAITGGNVSGLADGVLFLAPGAVLGAAVHHRYDPVDMSYISPALMFLTILIANTASLIIRGFQTMPMADPVTSSVILAVVAAMFTPGAFLGAWAAKRWWI